MDEHRNSPRMEEQDYATITVTSSPSAPSQENKTFMCLTDDLSVKGLQFSTFAELPVGTEMALHIAFRRPVRAFNHVAKVVWIKAREDASFSVGVEFTDSQLEKLAVWKDFVMQRLAGSAPSSDE